MFVIAQTVATLADGRPDAARCMSYGEAKAVYRGAYLHWHRGTHQRRCWGVRDRRRTGRVGPAIVQIEPDPILPNRTIEPPAERWNLLDHPAWAWVAAARLIDQPRFTERWLEGLEPPDEGVVFSTFLLGQEPEVWPALETETAAPW